MERINLEIAKQIRRKKAESNISIPVLAKEYNLSPGVIKDILDNVRKDCFDANYQKPEVIQLRKYEKFCKDLRQQGRTLTEIAKELIDKYNVFFSRSWIHQIVTNYKKTEI